MFNWLNGFLGFTPTKSDKEVIKTIKESPFVSTQVVGRGTLKIDPKEVANTVEFKNAILMAEKIVKK